MLTKYNNEDFQQRLLYSPLTNINTKLCWDTSFFFAANLVHQENIPAIVLSSQNPNEYTKNALLQELKWDDLDEDKQS